MNVLMDLAQKVGHYYFGVKFFLIEICIFTEFLWNIQAMKQCNNIKIETP